MTDAARGHTNSEDAAFPRTPLLALAGGISTLLLLTALHPDYGWFLDEMYYLACARHPALGYPDHPPVAPLLLALHHALFGDALLGVRIWPALCGLGTMLLAARVAWRLGGSLASQILAAICIAGAPILLAVFSIYSSNCFDVFFWTLALTALIELGHTGDRRLWWVVGAAIGLGLESKHTIAILGVAIAGGTLLSSARTQLLGRDVWIGVGIALALFLPNLWWQVDHDWMSLELYASADRDSNIESSVLEVLDGQIGGFNPATVPIWSAGLYLLLFSTRGRQHRQVGWTAAILFAVLLLGGRSRPDRIMGVYPVLFAAGAVQFEAVYARRGLGWLRVSLPAAVAVIGLAAAPLVVPILPVELAARMTEATGEDGEIHREVGRARLLLPLAHRQGNEEITSAAVRAWRSLEKEERENLLILAEGYAPASAIELNGPSELPDVYSPHQSYFLWGPPPVDPDRVIAVGFEPEQLAPYFARVEVLERAPCAFCMGWRQDMPVAIASEPRTSLRESWTALRHFGYSARKRYLTARD